MVTPSKSIKLDIDPINETADDRIVAIPGGTLQIVQVRRDDVLADLGECAWLVQVHCEMDEPDKTVIELPQRAIYPQMKLTSTIYFLLRYFFFNGENEIHAVINVSGGYPSEHTGDFLFILKTYEKYFIHYDMHHIPFELTAGQDYLYVRYEQPLSLDIDIQPDP